MLVPNLDEDEKTLQNLRIRFDAWLLENYTGSLALNLGLSAPFSGHDLQLGQFQNIIYQTGQTIEDIKQQPLGTCVQGVLKRKFTVNGACAACGVRPAESRFSGDEEYRCGTCQREVTLGGHLTKMDFAFWSKDVDLNAKPANILGLNLYLVRHGNLPTIGENILSVRSLNSGALTKPWAPKIIANYIPRFNDDTCFQDDRYARVQDPDFHFVPGVAKTFAHIGAEALERDEEGHFRGKPFLALLKADVDHLGIIFAHGLKRGEKAQDRFSLSRLAQLSRMMDLYFTGYLQGLIKREFSDTYTIYAGGDDLLLIGPWHRTLDLAVRIEETFRSYTGENPHITISSGLSLLHPNQPVNRAVSEAEAFLELAKEEGRNRICAIIGHSLSWDVYRERLADAQWIHEQMSGKDGVSTGFVYRVLEIARDAEAVILHGEFRKAGWRPRLAYHLARNLKVKNEYEKKEKIASWLQRLGLEDLLQLGPDRSNILDWRLPVSIALYRNRR